MPPRFVFLSDHGVHARFLVAELIERGVSLDAVLVQSALKPRGDDGFRDRVQSRIWSLRAKLRFYKHHRSFYGPLRTRVVPAGEANSAIMRRLLQQLAPDYLVVGSGSILKQSIIETAGCGVLNVHPGLLPWMRGSGVVGHSLKRGVPVGATLHFIDAGIDTGALIERRLLPITKTTHELGQLESAAHQLCARLLADVLVGIVETGQKPLATTQTVRFPLHRWPPKEERAASSALAHSGRALMLFEAWKSWTSGEPDWKLPPDLMEAPFALD